MIRYSDFAITESEETGITVIVRDFELADEFEDYLMEQQFVLFNIKENKSSFEFLFGQAASLDKVEQLIQKFLDANI